MAIQCDKEAHLPKGSRKHWVRTNCHLGWSLYAPKQKPSYNKGMVNGADSQDQP